tara:strand:+ start:726 stop:1046 length:321 start_codon:yes stop_codon:yes gene_type:complete
MALTETIEYDKIEVVSIYKNVQVRKATVIKKDGVELTRTFERYCLDCGRLKGGFKDDGVTPADDANDFIDTDISGQPAEVQAVCNAVWTDDVKTAFKEMLITAKST